MNKSARITAGAADFPTVTSLYVHVPFCARKCSYCAFYSEASDTATMERYVDCVARELEGLPAAQNPETVFFGGGTPSLLPPALWDKLLKALDRRGYLQAREITVECNPATVSNEKAALLRRFGVNRVSMGVQSFDEALLDRLGRIHSREAVFKSFDSLRKAGFENINIDLMFAIPGQSMEVWQATLGEALALQSEHVSTYEVIYEDDTPLFMQLQAGEVHEDEDLACAMYEELVSRVTGAGFYQYEIANFARNTSASPAVPLHSPPSLAARHNLNYWRGGQFFGVGPSATGYVRGVRTRNVANTQLYCRAIEEGRAPVESTEQLSPEKRAGEIAAFGLRMVSGIVFEEFYRTTGFELRDGWLADMQELERRGLAVIEPERFRLNTQGLRMADTAAEIFLR